jgi:hypothetical protein
MAHNTWFLVKFAAGGFGTFGCMLNTFIHSVMYLYYAIAALGPNYRKYIWWKIYLTKMQMVRKLFYRKSAKLL